MRWALVPHGGANGLFAPLDSGIRKHERNDIMGETTIQNVRKWFALICAIFLYYLIHEGSHVIVALLYGVFERIRILGVGVQVVAKVEQLTDLQTGIFCIVGSIATLLAAYVAVLLLPRMTASKSKVFRAIGYYATLVLLLLDPIYLSFRWWRRYEWNSAFGVPRSICAADIRGDCASQSSRVCTEGVSGIQG